MRFGDERVPARIWNKISCAAGGCWIWRGAFSGQPQARFVIERGVYKTRNVRRVLFEIEHGPQDAEAIGGCVSRCVNPAHAMAATSQQISIHWAAGLAPVTECPHGHVLAEVGVFVYASKGREARHCKACHRDQMREYDRRRRVGRLGRMSPRKRALARQASARARAGWQTRRSRQSEKAA